MPFFPRPFYLYLLLYDRASLRSIRAFLLPQRWTWLPDQAFLLLSCQQLNKSDAV